MRPKDENSYGTIPPQNGYRREYATMEPHAANIIKVITLRRRGNAPLGFSIRGGWEHGTGVFISEIVPGSIAQKQGLRVGDQIVRINGFSIHRAIHMEVLSLLKTCPGIVLKIKRVGILPVKEREKDPVTWRTVEAQSALICAEQVTHSRVNGSTLENSIIVRVEINVPGSASLGCSIAKGPTELPGIFMCTVKEGGIAEQAGLQVGDQILDMNGTSFHELQLNEAVSLMKSSKDIRLTVKKAAGISLFLDNGSARELSNGNKNEDTVSTTRSLSDGISTSIAEQPAFSCASSKSSSSFQSSDSEKDYSLSEESDRGVRRHHPKPSDAAWRLEEERRLLEEGRRRLEEEKKQLEEEKRKLELEKCASSCSGSLASSSTQPPSLEEEECGRKEEVGNSFLNELQRVAARMNTREGRCVDGDLVKTERAEIFKGKKVKEDTIKRMQHEMLMEEFREAHRKMFGQPSLIAPVVEKEHEKLSPTVSLNSTRMCVKSKPPPPPPKSQSECQKITVNGHVLQTLPRPQPETEAEKPAAPKPPLASSANGPTAATSVNGFRVTVTDKGRPFQNGCSASVPKNKSGTLVEVTPWTTRL